MLCSHDTPSSSHEGLSVLPSAASAAMRTPADDQEHRQAKVEENGHKYCSSHEDSHDDEDETFAADKVDYASEEEAIAHGDMAGDIGSGLGTFFT